MNADVECLPVDGRTLVAVSGGPDSTALLLSLQRRVPGLVAAHFDHRLRTGSERDADALADLCRGLGVPLLRGRRDRDLPPGSVPAAARLLRHQFLESARREVGATVIALGHTADDVVEGLLLHLLRGSALSGLRGMPPRRGSLIRPLLGVWRRDIEAFLADRGVTTFSDPANADLRYARARVRHILLPALEAGAPGISRRLLRVAGEAVRMQAALEQRAAALAAPGRFPLDAFAAEPPAVRREALRRLFFQAGGAQPGLDRRTLEAMEAVALSGGAGSGLDLPGGLRLRHLYAELEVSPRNPVSPAPASLVRWTCPGCAVTAAAHLRQGAVLTLGRRTPGLRMRPFPDRGSRKLQDILVDARVPRHRRDDLDLVFADGQLAWVPGIAVDARWRAAEGSPADHVELRGTQKGLC